MTSNIIKTRRFNNDYWFSTGLYLALCSLQVADDHRMLGSVQHTTQLLSQLQCGRSNQPWRFAPNPDEHIRPAVQDVDSFGVQKALQLKNKQEQQQ